MTSQLKVDKLQGRTTAGSITVTGEGTSAETNLQQGLAKAWGHITQTSTQSLDDSFNVSGITDAGTGKTTVAISNDMASVNYSVSGSNTQECTVPVSIAAGSYEQRCLAHDGSLSDASDLCITIHGDLA